MKDITYCCITIKFVCFVCEMKCIYWDANEIYIYFLNNRIRFLCIFPIPIFAMKNEKNQSFLITTPRFLAQE